MNQSLLEDQYLLRYSRHILLPEIDLEGQKRFSSACILAVGCGGLASSSLSILAAAGIGKLILIDDDIVDLSNLQRQLVYDTQSIGCLKTEAMYQRLNAINPNIDYQIVSERINAHRLLELTQEVDVLLDCSDNFKTRYLINQVALSRRIPLISAAAIRWSGQVAVFDFRQPESPCYACLFPDASGNDGACSVSGVFSPLVSMIGNLQAAETLKIIGGFGESLIGKLNCYNALHNQWQTFNIGKSSDCLVCAQSNELC